MGPPVALEVGMEPNTKKSSSRPAARFELRDSPAAAESAKVLATFATREEADKALAAKQQETPGVPFTIVDMGVPDEKSPDKVAAIEAGKTAEQKRLEKDFEEGRFARPTDVKHA
jgi:hypothetical protein